ncbi:MAG: DNA-processing protein DprA [Ruminococcus sp.]|nr:DNA-processing protein DprA [Ruminococcus sp.]
MGDVGGRQLKAAQYDRKAVRTMGIDKAVFWQLAVTVFGPGSSRLWEKAEGFDTVEEFTEALVGGAVDGLTEGERDRIERYGLKECGDILKGCKNEGLEYMCFDDPGYPERLRYVKDPPAMLYFKGDAGLLDRTVIHITGTRDPSSYSVQTAEAFCGGMFERGMVPSSGFAEGIDRTVCELAVKSGQPTVAVTAYPFSVDSPKGTMELKEEIARKGLVISEYYPGCRPAPNNFKARNRIAVGIAAGVLFIECSKESRGLDNLNKAMEYKRPVFAVPPHDIFDERYSGQAMMIESGRAMAVTGTASIAAALEGGIKTAAPVRESGRVRIPRRAGEKKNARAEVRPELTEKPAGKTVQRPGGIQGQIYDILKGRTLTVDEIAGAAGLDITTVLSQLMMMELSGTVRSLPGKRYAAD